MKRHAAVLMQEIENLKAKIETLQVSNSKSMEAESLKFGQKEENLKVIFNLLQGQIATLELANNTLKFEMKTLKIECDERAKTVSTYHSAIQQKEAKIKNLEADLAGLYQKMLQNENQVRQELNVQFTGEKSEILAQSEKKKYAELEAQKEQLEKAKENALMECRMKLKKEFNQHMTNVNSDYSKKLETTFALLSDKQNEVRTLSEKISALKESKNQSIKDLNEAMAKAVEEQINFREKMLEKFRQQTDAAEAAHTIKLEELRLTLDAKHSQILAEVSEAHKKQLNDLRTFFSLSTLNSRKEAENLKNQELQRLQSKHDIAIEKLRNNHIQEIAATLALSKAEKDKELDELVDKYERKIIQINKDYELCQRDMDSLSIDYKKIRFDHEQNTAALVENKNQLQKKETELKRAVKEHERNVAKLMFEFNAQMKMDKEKLQSKQLDELQAMLREFELARAFLKQEIENRDKM